MITALEKNTLVRGKLVSKRLEKLTMMNSIATVLRNPSSCDFPSWYVRVLTAQERIRLHRDSVYTEVSYSSVHSKGFSEAAVGRLVCI